MNTISTHFIKTLFMMIFLIISCFQIDAQYAIEPFETKSFDHPGGTTLPYLLFTPSSNSNDAKPPLIVALHGSAEVFNSLDRIFITNYALGWATNEVQEDNPCYVLAPHASFRFWDDIPLQQAIDALIATFVDQGLVDPNKIYLTGYSAGGSATWEYPVVLETKFAAIIPVSGFWRANAPELSTAAQKLRKIPTWNLHHEKDGDALIEGSLEIINAIEDENINFEEFDNASEPGLNLNHIFTRYKQSTLPCDEPRADCHYIINTVVKETKLHEWVFAQSLANDEDDSDNDDDDDDDSDDDDDTATNIVLLENKSFMGYFVSQQSSTTNNVIPSDIQNELAKWEQEPTTNGFFRLKNVETDAYLTATSRWGIVETKTHNLDNRAEWKDEEISNDDPYFLLVNRAYDDFRLTHWFNDNTYRISSFTNTSTDIPLVSFKFQENSSSRSSNVTDAQEYFKKAESGLFNFYPNPGYSILTIEGLKKGQFIQLVDIHGKRIKRIDQNGDAPINDIPSGLYLLQQIENGAVIQTEKYLIQQD